MGHNSAGYPPQEFGSVRTEPRAMPLHPDHPRRRFLQGLATAGAAGLLVASLPRFALGQAALPPTPACDDGDEPTPRQTEGPFFTPSSPERASLREPGMAGTPIVLTGFVLTRACRLIPGALVELWHADDAGRYDNDGYRLRGHQFTDAEGRYRFATIVPGLYTGRTRHFHVKYQAPNEPVLTTQLYFPGEPANQRDGIFRPELLVEIAQAPELTARFDAVLNVA
jgi:protocatechuate 3,4-dioxygenase beta subunit